MSQIKGELVTHTCLKRIPFQVIVVEDESSLIVRELMRISQRHHRTVQDHA
jgi:hypothetical protein